MASKMTPAQIAAMKAKAETANTLNTLATAAIGGGVTRAAKERADAELVRAVGKRKAASLKEDALQRAGARPKGLRRFFG
ncbi:hypothetical protein [Streptosporangium sp. NPDC006007]|uniref:hypothetical protein n=1 Tax=Streptosporangium sp. NPDC006007 TaxID=3154575 RepID=UPI00339F9017